MKTLHGSSGAPGIAIGRIARRRPRVATDLAPFPELVIRAVNYLRQVADRLRDDGMPSEAVILDAQALLANDPVVHAAILERLNAGMPTHSAIREAVDALVGPLEELEDPYLRERAADVRAVGAALLTADVQEPIDLPENAILIADDITPAEIVTLGRKDLVGLATTRGAGTSHVAILARSLGIPAVFGIGSEGDALPPEVTAIVDGDMATLIVEPDERSSRRYARQLLRVSAPRDARSQPDNPTHTRDGHRVRLWANIGGVAEVDDLLRAGAEGVGLFRTEFLFLGRQVAPSEDEQHRIYGDVLERMDGRPVVIRTLDVGGDKMLPYLPNLAEPTPALGERGIRLSQRFPRLFRAQLRALFRAAPAGDLRIMLPMVATIADVQWARAEWDAVARELEAEGVPHRATVPLGIMIETPAAAVMADRLATAVDFFSIGSNDLTQYTLAVDRALPRMAERYGTRDPAVFRLIELSVAGARAADIPVAVCGELAGDPEATEALLGIGLDTLSMSAKALAAVRARVANTGKAETAEAARRACAR